MSNRYKRNLMGVGFAAGASNVISDFMDEEVGLVPGLAEGIGTDIMRHNTERIQAALDRGGRTVVYGQGPVRIRINAPLNMPLDDSTLEIDAGCTLDATACVAPCVASSSTENIRLTGDGVIVCTEATVPTFTDVTNLSVRVRVEDVDGNALLVAGDGGSCGDGVDISALEVVVPWNGVDDTVALQAAIAATADPDNRTVRLIPGKIYVFTETLEFGEHFTMVGGVAGMPNCGELHYYGADATNAMQSASRSGAQTQSRFNMVGVRLRDMRTNPTSGSLLDLYNVDNGVFIDGCFFHTARTYGIACRADTAQAMDCIDIRRTWVSSNKTDSIGIYILRCQNNINMDWISSDESGGGAVIRIETITNDDSAISIRNVKHEPTDALTPTIHFPGSTKGNVKIESVIQRPQGGAAGNSVIKFDDASAGRVIMENIAGKNHGTWNSDPCTIEDVAGSDKIWGNVQLAYAGSSGKLWQLRVTSSNPQAALYGNVGDLIIRKDGGTTIPSIYYKRGGNKSNTFWYPMGPQQYRQTMTYAASPTPDISLGDVIECTLTGNINIQNAVSYNAGMLTVFELIQDATGGRTVNWGADYNFGNHTYSDTGNTADRINVIGFWSHGNSKCFYCVFCSGWMDIPPS